MQKNQCISILQTADRGREKNYDAAFGREAICRIPSNHKQAERIVIKSVLSGELEIDGQGQVWRTKKRHGKKTGGSYLLPITRRRAEHKLPSGYLQVRTMREWKRMHSLAHRLVWQFLYGDIPNGLCINHKNGIKDDNRPKNLEIVTYSQNIKHAYRNNLADEHGEKNPNAKLTNEQIPQIREMYATGKFTQENLGKMFKVAFQTISKIVRGDSRTRQDGETNDYTGRRKHPMKRDSITGQFVGKKKDK